MSKEEQAFYENKRIVGIYPNRGVIEIQKPNESNRENSKMFTYDAVYDEQ